jgi:membrane associated rhomboid family serine protease
VQGGGWEVLYESAVAMPQCQASLVDAGALVPARVWLDGQWWRLITGSILHGSWLHLVLNMWSLWVIGPLAERRWGTPVAAGLFAVGCLGGGLASLAWAEAAVVVGASAGVLALAAAVLVGRVQGGSSELEEVSGWWLGGSIVALVLLGAVAPGIAQAGHLGGLVVGASAAAAVTWGQWWRRLAAAAAAVVLIGLGTAAVFPVRPQAAAALIGQRLLELERFEEAVRAFDRALERDPSAELRNAVAYSLALAGTDLERAQRLAEEAVVEDPNNADYLDTIGWVLCRRGDVRQGLKRLEQALAAAEDGRDEIAGHVAGCVLARPERGK